ncbi:MAG: PAS domain S-box protein [Spirochaetaceae bacterium]
MSKKILLVEDEALIALSESKMLDKNGYEVVTVENGEKAVAAVEEDRDIDLILMDIDLGEGMDGTEAAEIILNRHDLPIAFLSSHTEAEVVEKTEGITSYGYIVKNSGETVLLASIKMAFRLFEAHRELKEQKVHLNDALIKYEHSAEQLAAKNEELNRYFTSSLDLLCIANTRGEFVRLNPEWERVLGYPLEYLEGTSLLDYVHHEDREATLEVLSQLNRQKDVNSFENRFICRDGSYRWIEWRSKPIGDMIYAAARDITRRKNAKQALQESEEKYYSLFDQAVEGVYLHDLEGNIIDVNQAVCGQTGYSREELLRLSVFDIHTAENSKRNLSQGETKRIWRDAREGERFFFDVEHRRKNGTIFPVRVSTGPVRYGENKVIMAIAEDISERKKAEQELRSKEESLRITLNSIGDAVIATDSNGNIERMNPVAERLCGWSENDALGRPLEEVFWIENADSRERLETPVERVMETGKIIGLANHTMLISKTGEEYQIADSAAPIKNDEGEINGVVLVFRDVTEEYKKNREIHESRELLDTVFTSIQDGISVLNPDLSIRYTNPVMERWYSSNLPLRGRKCYSAYHNGTAPCNPCPSLRCMESGKTESEIVKALPEQDSPVKWLELFSYPLTDKETGEIKGVIEFVRDISERKKNEQRIRSVQTRLQKIIDHSPLLINEIDSEGRYTMVNEATCTFIGMSKEELTGKHFNEVLPQETAAVFQERVGQVYSTGKTLTVDDTIDFHGKEHHYRTVLFPVLGEDNSVQSIVGIAFDTTSQVDALREKDFLMKELNHRVKNNLNLVSSLISLKDSETEEDLSDLKHRIVAIKMVHEKLHQHNDVDKIEVREYFHDLLESVFSLSAVEDLEIVNNIEEVDIPTKTAIPLGLVVNEIATNAVKYGFIPGKKAAFTIGMSKDPKNTHYVLTLSNSGNPFPEEVNLERPETLGLQLLTTLVRQIGGTIELKKRPYPEFTIRFPGGDSMS